MQGGEAGVGPAALELHEQGFFGWTGEVPRTFEGAISATRALLFLEEKVRYTVLKSTFHSLSHLKCFTNAWGWFHVTT